ncbi:MAG: hypothetical protein KAG20_11325 [Cocleimonas sp.]|nr:hypothetical protein [Cocleimonas sp.]
MNTDAYPNCNQIPSYVPNAVWWVLRFLALAVTLAAIYLLLTDAKIGLVVFWKILIPVLPITIAVMPGLWRNICPMGLLNQLPSRLGLSLQKTLPRAIGVFAVYLSILAFVVFVLFRHPVLNHNGEILGLLLSAALLLAFVGGVIFKGRSGWCGTFCPLAPIQKVYGHAPLIMVRNSYCEPCLSCMKNCYDRNPRIAIFRDIGDENRRWSNQYKFFIAMLPGLIVGFFTVQFSSDAKIEVYLIDTLTPIGLSIGLFYALYHLTFISFYRLASLYAMSAFVIFYWYGTPVVASGVKQLFEITLSMEIIRSIQYSVVVIGVAVFIRALIAERRYHLQQSEPESSTNAFVSKVHKGETKITG